MKRIFSGAAVVPLVLCIAIGLSAVLSGPALATNQTLTPTVTDIENGCLIVLQSASLAAAGADTAISQAIEVGKYRNVRLTVDPATGKLVRHLLIYGTAPANVDSSRVQTEWSTSETGPWIKDPTSQFGLTAVGLKFNNQAGGNVLTPRSVTSALPLRWMRVRYVNGDATTAGAIKLRIAVLAKT